MPIEAEMYNGTILEFPDNTDPSVIDGAVADWLNSQKLSKSPDGVSFAEAVKAGVENIGNAGTALKAGFADLFGNEELEQAAIGQYQKNQEKIGGLLKGATDWRDIVHSDSIGEGFSRTLDYVKEQFGLNSPQMATIMAGGLGTAAAAPYLPNPIATLVSKAGGFTVGATATALPMFTGWNLGRQIDEGVDPDIVKAGTLAVPQALTEATIAKIFTTTGLTKVGQRVFGETSEGIIKRVGQKFGEALAVGVPGEVIQQALERTAADLEVNPFTSEEAANEYIDTAFATAAALAPMSSVAFFHGANNPQNYKKYSKEDLEKILKEDVETAPTPKTKAFKTPEEATKGLQSLGINPEIFTPEGRVKAANLMVDRIDANRLKFFETTLGAPIGTANMLPQQKPVSGSIKESLRNGTALTNTQLENASLDDLKDIFPKPLTIETPKATPKGKKPKRKATGVDFEAAGAVLDEQARVVGQRRKTKSTTKKTALESKPSVSITPGFIMADLKQYTEGTSYMLKLSQAKLAELAKDQYKIPEKDLKDPSGKWVPQDQMYNKIMTKRLSRLKPLESLAPKGPLKSTPLERISPKDISAIKGDVRSFKPKAAPVSKVEPLIGQIDRVFKELKAPLQVAKDASVDPETKEFKKPLRAAQVANLLYTMTNFGNVKAYPNMNLNLMEAWEYYYDKLSKEDKKLLEDSLDGIKDALVNSKAQGVDTLPADFVNSLMGTEEGKREILAHMFSVYAQNRRMKNTKDTQGLPPKVRSLFSKLVNGLERSRSSMKGLGLNTFEDVFGAISETGVTPREAVFNSIERLRQERLLQLSDALQYQHWDSLDEVSIRDLVDRKIRETEVKNSVQKMGWWAKLQGSMQHKSSWQPIMGPIFELMKNMNAEQAVHLNAIRRAGEDFFTAPDPVKVRAMEIIDHLSNTDQDFTRDHEGNLVFIRGDKLIRIKSPEILKAIEAWQAGARYVLDQVEGDVRVGLQGIVEGGLTMTTTELKKKLNEMELNNEASQTAIDDARELVNIIDGVRAMKGRPFAPHMRFGPFGFTVHLKENIGEDGKVKPNTDPVYHRQIEEGRFKGRYNKFQYDEVQNELKEYRNKPEFVIFEDTKDNPFTMKYGKIFDRLGMDSVNLEMLAGLLGSDKTEEYFIDVKEELDRKTRYKGFSKRFAEKRNIPGYSKDWVRATSSYHMGAANFLARSKYSTVLRDIENKIEGTAFGDNLTWLKKDILKYLEYMKTPHDSFQNIRAINFMWTMGGNISSAALQIMSLPTGSLSSMTQYNQNPIENAKLLSKFFKIAFTEFPKSETTVLEDGVWIMRLDDPQLIKRLREHHGFTQDQIDFMLHVYREGRLGNNMLEEQAGKKQWENRSTSGQLRGKISKYSYISGILISAMEQATRFSTLMAHHEMFSNNPQAVKNALKVLKEDQRWLAAQELKKRPLVYDLALMGMDEAHAVFGKVGRSHIMRGGAGAFVFPFQTFPQQQFEFLQRMAGRGPEGRQALLYYAGALVLFAGLMGLPGGEAIKELAELIYKSVEGEELDLDYLIREKMTALTGDPKPGLMTTQGFFRAYLNLDVSRRIGMPLVGQDILLALFGVRGDMTDMLGVQGSILTNAVEAFRAYNSDESNTKVASLLTPTAFSNILKAIEYNTEGVETAKGTKLVKAEEIGLPDTVLRMAGFTSGEVASAREEQYWVQLENRRIKPKMDSFRKRGKNIMEKVLRAQEHEDDEAANRHREEYGALVMELQEFLQEKGQTYDISAFHRSVLDRLDQSVKGEVRLKDLNKSVRHRKEIIERTSGVKRD